MNRRRRANLAHAAYTMTEVLVVIGIIVLLLALAVPAFSLIRGARSIDSAENQVAAMLGRARADAIGLQKPFGVMFFMDNQTDRVHVAEVFAADFPDAGNPNREVYLDIVAETDYLALPPGVLAFTMSDATVNPAGLRTADGYIGYNTAAGIPGANSAALPAPVPTYTAFGGVVLFGGDGLLVSRTYGFITATGAGPTQQLTSMGKLLVPNFPVGTAPAFIEAGSVAYPGGNAPASAPGMILCDRESFANNGGVDDPLLTGGGYNANEEAEERWLDDNSIPLIINRYNGTLTRGE